MLSRAETIVGLWARVCLKWCLLPLARTLHERRVASPGLQYPRPEAVIPYANPGLPGYELAHFIIRPAYRLRAARTRV